MLSRTIPQDGLFILLEGCRIPALSIQVVCPDDSYAALSIVIPYHPSLWPPKWEITEVGEDEEESYDENGILIVNNVEVSGMQPHTLVQAFAKDELTGKTVWIQEGRIIGGVQKMSTPDDAYISFTALCSGSYPAEIQMFMTDKARSLGISSGSDWDGELASASPSDVASRIQSAGLGQGILAELENAGLNSNFFLNLLWRMMRYNKRFLVIDNPQALGYFNGSRIKTIFEKTLSKYDNKESIVRIISLISSILRYHTCNIAFPSFIQDTQDVASAGDVEAITDETEEINVEDMMINDYINFPDVLTAPPPRCNVIFPNQYGQMSEQYNFTAMPTRMIVRATGTGKLTSLNGDEAIVKPDEMKEKLASNRNYNSPEETYRGIQFSKGNLDAPEYMSDMSSDYIKGFYAQAYQKSRQGISINLGACTYNPKAVQGLPILVFSRDGNHIIGHLKKVVHSHDPNRSASTSYEITNARPYDTPVSGNAGDLWYESNIFGPEHIGMYFYPKILGKYEEERMDVAWFDDDMSILAVLYETGMTEEELRTAKEDELAIKNAANKIFEEYNNANNKSEYALRFGKRSQITFDQLIREFYGCSVSSDDYMATGGYSIATNSLSTFDGDDASEIELGERISDDAIVRGCYTKERQEAYLQAMQFFIRAKGLPIDDTYMQGAMEARQEALMQMIAELDAETKITATARDIVYGIAFSKEQ